MEGRRDALIRKRFDHLAAESIVAVSEGADDTPDRADPVFAQIRRPVSSGHD